MNDTDTHGVRTRTHSLALVCRLTWRSSWDAQKQEGWYTGELNGVVGQLPSTYVRIVEEGMCL